MKSSTELSAERLKSDAWIGDAVLSLFARQWILEHHGKTDGERLRHFSSNQFLACFGPPTQVEATIGEIFKEHGLETAFTHIETELLPIFLKQEKNRAK